MHISFFYIYFETQSTFMEKDISAIDTLKDIKQIMERSSRFISLSGLSGVAAGICALAGAWFARPFISGNVPAGKEDYIYSTLTIGDIMEHPLFTIALLTLCSAIAVAFLFTWLKAHQNKAPIWSAASKRLILNFCIPLVAGGIFLLRMAQMGYFELIAPGCLLFYGVSLVNAAKYTLGEVRYLGYAQIALGLTGCWFPEAGLFFWALGFGVLHIIYGTAMWWKYDKKS